MVLAYSVPPFYMLMGWLDFFFFLLNGSIINAKQSKVPSKEAEVQAILLTLIMIREQGLAKATIFSDRRLFKQLPEVNWTIRSILLDISLICC